jgi:glucose uptake protein GlcU
MPVYSQDRVFRLRLVLFVVVALGALTMVFATDMLLGDADAPGVVAMVVGLLLLGSGVTAVLLLREARRPAQIATVVAGVVCVISGLVLAGSWLALLLPLIGLGLLFLALIADDPEAVR